MTLTLSTGVGGQGGFGRPFDLSKFPNLEEVDFGASYRVTEDLHWIPASLSTLRPATSPRLSAVQLTFTHSPQINRFVEAAIETMGNDLRRTANEVTRIQRKFGGGVNLTVVRDTGFKAVFDKLSVRFHSCRVGDFVTLSIHFRPFLADPLVYRRNG